MMPGQYMPGRRQAEQQYHYQMPPQTHSPVHHNPYANYHQYQPQQYGPPHGYPQHMQQMQQMPQWYLYQQPPLQPLPQPQYAMPPRQFQPQGSPVVVSSNPHMAHLPPANPAMVQTPPIVQSRTPPMPRMHTPQPAPSTPLVHAQAHLPASTPHNNTTIATPPPMAGSKPTQAVPQQPQPTVSKPFYPPLPWLSVPDAPFPPRAAGRRRRRRAPVSIEEEGLALPSREQVVEADPIEADAVEEPEQFASDERTPIEEPEESQASTIAAPSDIEVDTPSTSHPPSEIDVAPVSTATTVTPTTQPAVPATKHSRNTTKPAVPLIPIRSAKNPSATSTTQKSAKSPTAAQPEPVTAESSSDVATEVTAAADTANVASPPKPAPPKSWAELLRAKGAPAAAAAPSPKPNGVVTSNGPTVPKGNTLADVLASFSIDSDKKVSFLEPRGLVNTGNLCYMNSILQVLLFCAPFYDFLDQVAKQAVHSFKSETPLIDAMIMFMRDFKLIDSASSVEQLRLRLKDNELEQYGDPLTPEYVYDVIKRLPRFDNMKRGQQEDAEEFLGFLLAGLHDECARIIKNEQQTQTIDAPTSPTSERSADGGWHEVGAKQKTSVTQNSGTIEIESPVTKIFGGKLRSEYKRHGEKPSVTLEPYQPLQLDIGGPNINNITDALRNMTRLETLDGAARGARASTKQVHIETLPPVLILHLKRFHYDEKGPQKIWKKIGYPLELEIPKEMFPQHKRAAYIAQGGFPRYRLTAAVYHHGKNASGGHYTVDLRRQEGKEWIRMDDTVIRRVRAEDVAEGGAEEDPKVLLAALEQHKSDAGKNKNFFAQIDMDEEELNKGAWSQVNGADKQKDNTKKWSGVVNGAATPNSAGKRTPLPKENVRDNKVAYILFYQRIES